MKEKLKSGLVDHRVGFNAQKMGAVRSRLESLGLVPYDYLSPELMDAIAPHAAKKRGTIAAA